MGSSVIAAAIIFSQDLEVPFRAGINWVSVKFLFFFIEIVPTVRARKLSEI